VAAKLEALGAVGKSGGKQTFEPPASWHDTRQIETHQGGTTRGEKTDSLNDFRTRLQDNAERFDLIGRRKVIRLLVKEILVVTATITIRHSIPLVNSTPEPTTPTPHSAHPPPDSGER